LTPGNLPVELSSFVGRGRELLEIRRLLALTHTVTLTGSGGIGKSRLALRAAHTLGRHFPDGVWWIELDELDTPDLVAQALAHALNVYERPDVAIGDAVVRHLRDRRLLIVLDDCEGQLDASSHGSRTIAGRAGGHGLEAEPDASPVPRPPCVDRLAGFRMVGAAALGPHPLRLQSIRSTSRSETARRGTP